MRSLNMTSRNVIAVLAGALVALPVAARAQADLSVVLDEPATVIHYGETVTYTALITNQSATSTNAAKINAITLTDSRLELMSVTGCKPDSDAALVPCTIGDGVIGGEVDPAHPTFRKTVTFDVALPMPTDADEEPVLPTDCPNGESLGTISITAEPGSTHPTDSVSLIVGNWTDLGITMDAPATSSIGATFDVVATVTNAGPCAATQVAADDEQGITGLGIEFLGADGDCDQDPLAGTCSWDTLGNGESKSWTIHYRVLNFPSGLMQASEIVSITVFSEADDAFDYNADNDVGRTDTIVKKDRANCSTGGGMGQALGLLVLAVPFLRRRRKS